MADPITLPTFDGRLPDRQYGGWRIQLWQRPILHRGHAFLALVDPNGKTVQQLHGLAMSRNTGELVPIGMDGARLVAGPYTMSDNAERVADVAYGPYNDIVAGKWARGLQAADEINRRNLDYKADDPSYEFGGDGGQIQSSNSGTYTFGKAMGVDLDEALRESGMERRFPGWGRDLLDQNYEPYVAPPDFPSRATP